jgi:hypothetical protein
MCIFPLLSSLTFSANAAAAPQAEAITIKLQTPAYHIAHGYTQERTLPGKETLIRVR